MHVNMSHVDVPFESVFPVQTLLPIICLAIPILQASFPQLHALYDFERALFSKALCGQTKTMAHWSCNVTFKSHCSKG